ncbi:hypothetical protein TFLX_01722 [Thermoflexales bacterium]|jgi:ABC-type transporter Mla subunit MlaD|nr:hypothetical protein TFLX_01722 [Thermoflexales bacterium]
MIVNLKMCGVNLNMSLPLKRGLGVLLVVLASASFIFSVGGLMALWGARPAITAALQDTANLISETLVTTQKALTVADEALQNAGTSLALLSGSVDSLADSMGNTQQALVAVTVLVQEDLPQTIEAARTALTSAQETARVVDNFLGGISRIQFLNINYNPAVPLGTSIAQINASLDNLPSQLTQLGDDLAAVNASLPVITTTIRGLGTTLGEIDTSVTEARAVLDDYADQLQLAQTTLQPIGADLPQYVILFTAGLTFIMLWISVVQIGLLVIGLHWIRSDRAVA